MVSHRFAKMVSRPRLRVLLEAPDFEVCQLSSRSAPLCFCSVKSSRESRFFSHFVFTWDFLEIYFCDHIHFRSILHPPENSWAMKRWGGTNSLWSVIDVMLVMLKPWLTETSDFRALVAAQAQSISNTCWCAQNCDHFAAIVLIVIETIHTLERCSKKLRKCIWILERFFFNFHKCHKCRWPHWSSKSHRLMLVTCNPSKFFLYVTAVIVAVE